MKQKRISCYNCTHFFITWDQQFPRGCRAMDFKSRRMPSTVVSEASGMPCIKFRPGKEGPPSRNKKPS